MKSLVAVIAAFMGNRSSRSNFKTLLRLISLLLFLVAIYSVVFHLLMEREGQHFSWITGVYWTLTVMTTLGFGDITFHGDLGRLFSIIVLMTGVMFLLVILPFTFIEFFYAPWMKAQASARTPRELPADTRDHVIFTDYDPITRALIPMLEKYGHSYVVLTQNMVEGLELYEQAVHVAVGDHLGERIVNPEPDVVIPADGTLLLIGTLEAEERFLKEFEPDLAPKTMRQQWRTNRKA